MLFCQLASAVAFVTGLSGLQRLRGGGGGGIFEGVERLEWAKAKAFLPAGLSFLAVIFTNIKVLQHANVETFIVARCSTPLLLSLADYAFLRRQLPSARSWGCLVTILLGAIGYVACDSTFDVGAAAWLGAWYAVFMFEMTYLKYLCDTLPMTQWGRVLYNNLIGMVPLAVIGLATREVAEVAEMQWSVASLVALGLSCGVGVGMSYTSFWVRSMVSATAFTVVGIMCKLGTVVLNYFYWEKHASREGIACLLICLLAGSLYRQAPLKQAL